MSWPGPPEHRRDLIIYEGHTDSVDSVVFWPDGKSVVSGSRDRTIRIWDAHNPHSIGEPLKGHAGSVYSVSCAPLGYMIASGSEDGTIRLWDLIYGRQVGGPLIGHKDRVVSVAFSPKGNHIASGSEDETIRLWDVKSGTSTLWEFENDSNGVFSVAFSPDGTRLASGSADKIVRVWDVERGKPVFLPLNGHMDCVRSVSFSPDGSQIVSGSWDNTLRLWDARTGGIIGNPYEGHSDMVISVAFSPNGTYVASSSADQTVCIWDVRTGRQVTEPFAEHSDYVFSVAFSPCGRRLASCSYDQTVMIWSLENGDSEVKSGTSVVESVESVREHMSATELFNLLIRHGCVNLASGMDPNQDAAILISGGGFGDIWKGELYDRTKVSIKVWRECIVEQCSYKTLKRATREIHHWSKMKHTNVHSLMGIIMFRGKSLGMVSEWMNNGNLHEYMRKQLQFDRYQMCAQIASGLAYMHEHNAVHGDLKALNILVSPEGVAKLTDFGLSIMAEASIAFSDTSNPQTGSTRWAAPELLSEETAKSKQSDVYALGMTMLEVLTGELPYPQCQREYQVLTKVLNGVLPPRPTDRLANDEDGNRIWNLLVSCWDRNPDARPLAEQVVESVRRRANSPLSRLLTQFHA